MISLYRDPECKTVVIKLQPKDIDGQKTDNTVDGLARSDDAVTMKKRIKELESHIQSQQRQLDSFTNRDGSLSISSEREKSLSKSPRAAATSS